MVELTSAGILEHSMVARNQVGVGLSYRPARLHRLAESIPWNRFLGKFKNTVLGLQLDDFDIFNIFLIRVRIRQP